LAGNPPELAEQMQGYELARYKFDEQTGQLKLMVTSTVPDYLKPYQAETELHQRIWDYFTGIFPVNPDAPVSYMVVYMDGSSSRFAARMQESNGKWWLHINLLDIDSPQYLIEILTHEYAHMLTLNKDQVEDIDIQYGFGMEQTGFDAMRSTCRGRFFDGFSCSLEKSYLNAFGNRFWIDDIYESWMKAFLMADNDKATYRAALEELYATHRDQFISSYAATNPREDIAESWTAFVLRPRPTGTSIADQKVQFFYEFPELVQLRTEIMHRVCQYAIDQK
jgi:hypothetical protein